MVAVNIQELIGNAHDLVAAIMEEGYIPADYTVEDIERLRDKLEQCWERLEDGDNIS